jgi:hypothetical protein
LVAVPRPRFGPVCVGRILTSEEKNQISSSVIDQRMVIAYAWTDGSGDAFDPLGTIPFPGVGVASRRTLDASVEHETIASRIVRQTGVDSS